MEQMLELKKGPYLIRKNRVLVDRLVAMKAPHLGEFGVCRSGTALSPFGSGQQAVRLASPLQSADARKRRG